MENGTQNNSNINSECERLLTLLKEKEELMKKALKRKEEELCLFNYFCEDCNEDYLITIEKDINKINKEKERINLLSEKDLFYEALKKKSKMSFDCKIFREEYPNENLYKFFMEIEYNNYYSKIDIKQILDKLYEQEVSIQQDFKDYCALFLFKFEKIEKPIFNIKNYEDEDIILEEINSVCDTKMKEILNEDISVMLKDMFPEEKIDIKLLKNELEKDKYNNKKICPNLYNLIREILADDSDNGNVILNFEGILEIFKMDENIKNEFKKYYSWKTVNSIKLNLIKEKISEKRAKINEIKINLMKSKLNVIKKIQLSSKKDFLVKSIFFLNDKFIIYNKEDLHFYDSKSSNLISIFKIILQGNLLILKKGRILGKIENKNYCYLINPKNLNKKKIVFPFSQTMELETKLSDGKIIMQNDDYFLPKCFIYSKENNIYRLTNILLANKIYEFTPNEIFSTFHKDIYLYSKESLQLIKFKKFNSLTDYMHYIKINDNQLFGISPEIKFYFYFILDLNTSSTIA